MTRKDLKQYRGRKHEIAYLRRKLAGRPPMAHDSVTGSSIDFPYTEGVIPIQGIDQQEREEQWRRLHALEVSCKAVDSFIGNIEDSRIRLYITLKYVEGQSWEQVATNVKDNVDADAIRKAVERFIKKVC